MLSEVLPGNIYPSKQRGRHESGTCFWLVIAVTEHAAHLLGYDKSGNPVSTSSYTKSMLRERPVLATVDISILVLKPVKPSMPNRAKGGHARAKSLDEETRREIAKRGGIAKGKINSKIS
jgi:hypothetical protein